MNGAVGCDENRARVISWPTASLGLGHRTELLDQITQRCRMHRPDIPVGRIEAGYDQRGFPITVGSVPTLGRGDSDQFTVLRESLK